MLVRVKEPLTEIRLSGEGSEQVLADLRSLYKDRLEVDEDEDYVDIRDTEWYHARKETLTPGKRLRIYRENSNFTLTLLAELTGISKGNLSQMEHDKRPLGKLVAQKLAKSLGCDYRSLL
jgi:DNA-binding XRE family transcriptional regulator